MKQAIMLTVLLLFSVVSNAASIEIGNPVAYSGPEDASVKLLQSSTISNSYVEAIFEENFELGQRFSVGFELAPSVDGFLSVDIGATLQRGWDVTIIDQLNNPVFSGSSTGLDLVHVNSSLMQAGSVYNLLVSGREFVGSQSLRGLTITMENIQVSEVPLPAAVWLFGTALLGGLALRRKRNQVKLAKTV